MKNGPDEGAPLGTKKEGMDICPTRGVWGYAPLIVSLAKHGRGALPGEPAGAVPSHKGAVEWIDRAVVVRKNISRMRGENALVDEIRYLFYIHTRRDIRAAEVVRLANARCRAS